MLPQVLRAMTAWIQILTLHILAVQPWASYPISLGFHFLTSKVRILASISQGCQCKVTGTVPDIEQAHQQTLAIINLPS